MSTSKKIHFEISERKILLRVMDVFFPVLTLALIGHYFQFDYFRVSQTSFYWTIVLAIYLIFFGTIFANGKQSFSDFKEYYFNHFSNGIVLLINSFLHSHIALQSFANSFVFLFYSYFLRCLALCLHCFFSV